MERKSRVLIYERKEVLLLLGLAAMVGLFAFTFGVHLGKRVPTKAAAPEQAHSAVHESEVPGVNSLPDHEPTRHEAQEQAAHADGDIEVFPDEVDPARRQVHFQRDGGIAGHEARLHVVERRAHAVVGEDREADAAAADDSNSRPLKYRARIHCGTYSGYNTACNQTRFVQRHLSWHLNRGFTVNHCVR